MSQFFHNGKMTSFNRILGQSLKSSILVILPFNFDLKFCWNWSFFHYEKIMRFIKSPQLPGAGRTWAWHYHGSHMPTSPGAILLSKTAFQPKHFGRQCILFLFSKLNHVDKYFASMQKIFNMGDKIIKLRQIMGVIGIF